MPAIDLSGKRVLEVIAGDIRRMSHSRGQPAESPLEDVSTDLMDFARARLTDAGIPNKFLPVGRHQALPIDHAYLDVIVTFYSLEHLYLLCPYFEEMCRLLNPAGTRSGTIPAEGGPAWG